MNDIKSIIYSVVHNLSCGGRLTIPTLYMFGSSSLLCLATALDMRDDPQVISTIFVGSLKLINADHLLFLCVQRFHQGTEASVCGCVCFRGLVSGNQHMEESGTGVLFSKDSYKSSVQRRYTTRGYFSVCRVISILAKPYNPQMQIFIDARLWHLQDTKASK